MVTDYLRRTHSDELAQRIVQTSAIRAKEVAEQQQKDKEEAAKRKIADEEATRRLLMGDGSGETFAADGQPVSADAESRAADILGGNPAAP